MSTPLPLVSRLELDVSQLPPTQRVEAWRSSFSRFYELPDATPDMTARGSLFRLGEAALTDTIQLKSFVREPAGARRDGGDSLLISLEISGDFELETARGVETVGEGRVTVFDMSRPVVKRGAVGRTLVLGVPRDLVNTVLPGRDLHGVTLQRGELMAEHLRSLRRHAADAPSAGGPHLVRSAVELLAACLLPTEERIECARGALVAALLGRAKALIRANHGDTRLTPAAVAAAVGVSRSSLYRAFEPEGGVLEFIRTARLEAARAALEDARDLRRISEIAYAHGFTSEAHFSRLARAAFGAPPGELRRRALAAPQAAL